MSAHSPSAQLAAVFDQLGLSASSALAAQAGVTLRQAANAITGRPVAAGAFLRLCVVVQHDPAPDIEYPAPSEPREFDCILFAMALRIIRGLNGDTERAAGKKMQMSATTVCRLEQGYQTSIGVVLRACRYLGRHPYSYLRAPPIKQNVPRETSRQISATV